MSEQPVCNNNNCNFCDKKFTSFSTRCVHIREKHTYYNTIKSKCTFCFKEFFSVIFNQKLNKRYLKCEECRELQLKLNTNDIVNNSYIYSNKERYFANDGKISRVCGEYTCQNLFECPLHDQKLLIQCSKEKCNNCYIKNGSNQCERCINLGYKSKNKTRNKLKEFKEELGGKCVDCGFNKMFFLEFDHIDPKKKTIQITRSAPSAWQREKYNLELRCGRCHRIKTSNEIVFNPYNKEDNKHVKCKNDKKSFVNSIKKYIGKCQLCEWTLEDKDIMCPALDFDHVIGEKYKQISRLYTTKKENIAKEILKTRLLCRHCHEIHTCLQRGGKALDFYYSKDEIKEFSEKLNNQEHINNCLNEIKLAILNNT
jgi:hypothetical protein